MEVFHQFEAAVFLECRSESEIGKAYGVIHFFEAHIVLQMVEFARII